MPKLLFITHPEVTVDPTQAITDWSLSETGKQRAARFAGSKTFSLVSQIWSSDEYKARQTAEILSSYRSLSVSVESRLGENDRSATGYLAPEEFERAVDDFFAMPNASFNGWETASDAQARIETASRKIVEGHIGGDLAIVAHGAVGTLLFCQLSGLDISRRYDQPSQGHWWSADLPALVPNHGWRSIG